VDKGHLEEFLSFCFFNASCRSKLGIRAAQLVEHMLLVQEDVSNIMW
jgi:hypothetical protein